MKIPHRTLKAASKNQVTVKHISDFPPEKQAEWEALKGYDAKANKAQDTTAKQKNIKKGGESR